MQSAAVSTPRHALSFASLSENVTHVQKALLEVRHVGNIIDAHTFLQLL